jgi:hypothetical protein|nr:MAG TPA: hypothetical protein [Caudoviricetes sp.]
MQALNEYYGGTENFAKATSDLNNASAESLEKLNQKALDLA